MFQTLIIQEIHAQVIDISVDMKSTHQGNEQRDVMLKTASDTLITIRKQNDTFKKVSADLNSSLDDHLTEQDEVAQATQTELKKGQKATQAELEKTNEHLKDLEGSLRELTECITTQQQQASSQAEAEQWKSLQSQAEEQTVQAQEAQQKTQHSLNDASSLLDGAGKITGNSQLGVFAQKTEGLGKMFGAFGSIFGGTGGITGASRSRDTTAPVTTPPPKPRETQRTMRAPPAQMACRQGNGGTGSERQATRVSGCQSSSQNTDGSGSRGCSPTSEASSGRLLSPPPPPIFQDRPAWVRGHCANEKISLDPGAVEELQVGRRFDSPPPPASQRLPAVRPVRAMTAAPVVGRHAPGTSLREAQTCLSRPPLPLRSTSELPSPRIHGTRSLTSPPPLPPRPKVVPRLPAKPPNLSLSTRRTSTTADPNLRNSVSSQSTLSPGSDMQSLFSSTTGSSTTSSFSCSPPRPEGGARYFRRSIPEMDGDMSPLSPAPIYSAVLVKTKDGDLAVTVHEPSPPSHNSGRRGLFGRPEIHQRETERGQMASCEVRKLRSRFEGQTLSGR